MDGFTGFKTAASEELARAVAVIGPLHWPSRKPTVATGQTPLTPGREWRAKAATSSMKTPTGMADRRLLDDCL